MYKIAITDYFEYPAEEKEILGDLVGMEVGADTEVLLVWHAHIDKDYIQNLPNLRGVQRYGVGYDTLDVDYLKSKGIVCCNNPDYGTDEVADTALAMIINISRGILQYNHQAKKYYNNWQENIHTSIKRHSDMVIGVIGAGRIGGSLILKCNSLKFKVVFYDPYKERGHEKMLSANRVDTLEELLAMADIVSIHAPLSKETKGMIDATFINQLKPGSSIVNTARGGFFGDLDLLYEALKTDKINCLAIDVLPDEPPKPGLLLDAWRKSEDWLNGRLVINPHTSYYSQAAYRELRINAAKNALRMYKNEKPYNVL